MTTRHALTASKIYETIYSNKLTTPNKVLTQSNNIPPVKNDKKEEIIKSLNYLKSKPIKSKQDKSSISMLEGILASIPNH